MMEAGLNLVISIALAYQIGLLGVLIGTLVSFCVFSFWTKPYFVYRDVFGVPFVMYALWEGKKITIAFIIGLIIYAGTSFLSFGNIYLDFTCKAIISVVVSNLLLIIFFYKTDEFGYIRSFASSIIGRCRQILARK